MAKVKIDKQTIKANVSTFDTVIKANIIKKDNVIKSNLTSVPTATTEKKGIIKIATDEEAIDGTLDNIAITPHTLKLATYYEHEQGIASDVWIINHNLNKKPSIMVVDSSDNVVEGAERYIDANTIEIRFNGAFKGKAYLN